MGIWFLSLLMLAAVGCQSGAYLSRPGETDTTIDTPDSPEVPVEEAGDTEIGAPGSMPQLIVPSQMSGGVTRSSSERFVNVGGLSSSGGGIARGEKYQSVNVQIGFAQLEIGVAP